MLKFSRDIALRAEVAQAKDATHVLALLIAALMKDNPAIANRLSLNQEAIEEAITMEKILTVIDRDSVPRKINDFDTINQKQDQAAALFKKLNDKIQPFIIEKEDRSEPLKDHETMAANLMKECSDIIQEAFPGIAKALAKKLSDKAVVPHRPHGP